MMVLDITFGGFLDVYRQSHAFIFFLKHRTYWESLDNLYSLNT